MIEVLFMGRKPVAAQCLAHLLQLPQVSVTAVITDSHLPVSPTRAAAEAQGIPVLDWKEALARAARQQLRFDLALSVLFWRRIPPALLAVPRLGTINFHPALLPQYKGTAGYNLAILEGRQTWGASAHYVDAEIDTGPIIRVREFPMNGAGETALSLEAKTQPELRALFVEVVNGAVAADGLLPTTPNVGGTYTTRAEMEAMKQIRPGDDVARKVRAFFFPPYDGAFIEIDGARYTLIDRMILESLADPTPLSLFKQDMKC